MRAPRILLVFWDGKDDLRGNNLLRRVIMAHHSIQRDGHALFAPIAGAFSGPIAPDGSYEKPNIDVLPTLLDLCAISKPRNLKVDGMAVTPLLVKVIVIVSAFL